MRYYDDFSNKLFELWCLYNIKQTFECVFLLDKCSHSLHPLSELRGYIQKNVKQNKILLEDAVDILRKLNESIGRLSAHTTVMTYEDLIVTRQIVLGIGNLNIFYTLKDLR